MQVPQSIWTVLVKDWLLPKVEDHEAQGAVDSWLLHDKGTKSFVRAEAILAIMQ
jgi:hypothetical protein